MPADKVLQRRHRKRMPQPMGVHVRKSWFEACADTVGRSLEHRRPRGEGPTAIADRDQARSSVRRDQPAPLSRGEAVPAAADTVDPPAPFGGLGHHQRFPPSPRRPPPAPVHGHRPIQLPILVQFGQRIIGNPGRAEPSPLGHPGRHRERDRDLGRFRWKRRDFVDQQIGELLQPQPARQRQPADGGVAGKLAAMEPGVLPAVRHQPSQPLHEQLHKLRLEVLDRDVWFRCAPDRQVHLHLTAGSGEQCPRRAVGERLCRGIVFSDSPPIEHRQHTHVPAPGRSSEPLFDRAGRPMLGISAQGTLQPGT